MEEWTLHALREEFGISRRVVQGYEKYKLVKPCGRNERGHLIYSQQSVDRILLIRRYSQFGFPLRKISGLLSADSEELCSELTVRCHALKTERDELDRRIKDLDSLIKELT